MDILSARKILSVTQQVLRPNYNRVTWKFSSAGKSTNLAESYIVFRMTFINGVTNADISKDEYYALLMKNLCISFGDDNGKSYTPACLVKHARLFIGGGLVEEVLFSNLWTQTIANLCNDVESLESNSLLTGGVSNFSTNGSIANQIASSIRNYATSGDVGIPLEVHLKLGDIFGVCRNTNFIMDKVGGEIMIQMELEDVKNVLQVRSIGSTYPLPVQGTVANVYDSLATSRYNIVCQDQGLVGQSTYKYVNTTTPNSPFINAITSSVQNPDGLFYDSSLFKNIWSGLEDPTVQLGLGKISTLYTSNVFLAINDLNILGFQVGNYIRFNFKRTDKTGLTVPVMFHYMQQITEVNIGNIVFQGYFQAPLPIVPDGELTDTQLDSVNVFRGYVPVQNIPTPAVSQYNACDTEIVQIGQIDDFTPGTGSNIATFLKTGVIPSTCGVNTTLLNQLCSMGVLSTSVVNTNPTSNGTEYVVNKDSSQIMIQMNALDSTTPTHFFSTTPCGDVFLNPDSSTQRKIYSNQATTMPVEGTNAVIESINYDAEAQTYSMTLRNLGSEGPINNSIQVGVPAKNLYGREATIVPLGGTFPAIGTSAAQANFGISASIFLYKHRSRNTTLTINQCLAGQSYRIDKVGTSTLVNWNTLITLPEPAITSNASGVTFKCNVNAVPDANLGTGTVYLVSPLESVPISWAIDKAEIVLLESSDVSLPMSNIFSTLKCEPFTIENANELYNRMFVVSEPNVYNAYLMMPQSLTEGDNKQSLISYNRNVQSIIWSINNLQTTNRPIELMNNISSNPSSLQIEAMMAVFENSEHKLKAISGIQSIARTNRNTPVIAPMVKIYSAIDAMNHYLKPNGCTLQITMNGDRTNNNLIIPGNCYLFKECLRMLPML